jgi:hypothetical protein
VPNVLQNFWYQCFYFQASLTEQVVHEMPANPVPLERHQSGVVRPQPPQRPIVDQVQLLDLLHLVLLCQYCHVQMLCIHALHIHHIFQNKNFARFNGREEQNACTYLPGRASAGIVSCNRIHCTQTCERLLFCTLPF